MQTRPALVEDSPWLFTGNERSNTPSGSSTSTTTGSTAPIGHDQPMSPMVENEPIAGPYSIPRQVLSRASSLSSLSELEDAEEPVVEASTGSELNDEEAELAEAREIVRQANKSLAVPENLLADIQAQRKLVDAMEKMRAEMRGKGREPK